MILRLYTKLFFTISLFTFIANELISQNSNDCSNTKYDSVVCSANPNFTYCIYLPPKYSDTNKLPILIVNEPAGRASLAIDSFLIAAKKYNYIIASSYNSKNGSLNNLFESTDHLMNDVFEKYSVNENRVYLAGFSGGSRGATAIAFVKGDLIKGIIGCGAGAPVNKKFRPNKYSSFCYYGIVGNLDMNFLEMKKFETYLSEQNINHNFRYFEGKHTWPNSNLLKEAIAWLELQAINKKLSSKNSYLIQENLNNTKHLADTYLKNNNYIDAVRVYNYIIEDFESHLNINEISNKIDSIQSLKQFNHQLKSIEDSHEKEDEWIKLINVEFNFLADNTILTDKQLKRWIEAITSFNTDSKSLINQRLLQYIQLVCVEWGNELMASKNYQKAQYLFNLWTTIMPKNLYAHYYLARSYAFQNLNNKSIESLKNAIEFMSETNKSKIKEDEAFKNLKKKKKFKELFY